MHRIGSPLIMQGEMHRIGTVLDFIGKEVGFGIAHREGSQPIREHLRHPLAVGVVNVHHPLFGVAEQHGLGLKIGFHGFVVVQMILG